MYMLNIIVIIHNIMLYNLYYFIYICKKMHGKLINTLNSIEIYACFCLLQMQYALIIMNNCT